MTRFTLVRRIAARPAILFDALTTAQGLAAWWGPDDLPVISAESDARVGGAYRVRFRTLDGLEHEAFGQFLELTAPLHLAMTWRYALGGEPAEEGRTSRIEIEIKAVDDGAELTFTHADLRDADSVASHERGWSGAFAKLVRLFAQSQTPTG